MTVNLSMLAGAGAQFFDNSGVILSGGLVYTYAAGTTTPQAAYTTSSGGTAHSNPIVLDSAGRVASGGEIWLTDSVAYKFVLKTSAAVTIATYDNITGNTSGVYTTFAASSGASLVGYTEGGTGAVATTVQAKLRENISVLDFGAYNNGTNATATTAAITAAIAAVGNGRLYFPNGTYAINSTITIDSRYGLTVDFCGSIFNWTGASGSSAFIISDCLNCSFSNGRINSSSSYPMQAGFKIENAAGTTVNPSKSIFNNITVEGTNLNGLTYGFYISKNGGGGDAGNDFHHFNDCASYNYTNSGLYMDGTQQYGIMLTNPSFVSASGAAASTSVTHNASGGSLFVYGGGGGNNTYTDFLFTGTGRPCTIDGFSSEQSASFLRTTGSGEQYFVMTLLNCQWETDNAAQIYSDKKVVNFTYQGQLIIDGCKFTSTSASANYTIEATGGSYFIQKAGQIRASHIQSTAVNPLVGTWDIDNTSVIERAALTLAPILLNTASYGTGQFNGVNSSTIILYGASTIVFYAGSAGISTINETPGIRGFLGQKITLIFNTAVTVTNGTIKLAGGTNFNATADDTLTLVYNGSGTSSANWLEVSRSVN